MINVLSRFRNLASPRVPRLYYGPGMAEPELTGRQKLAEDIYVYLKIFSEVLFFFTAFFGYHAYGLYGLVLFAVVGYGVGAWIRRSLGVRGSSSPTKGFFRRMRERANGSPPGLLEGMLERYGNFPLSREQCRNVALAEERAIKQLTHTVSKDEQNRILADLDRKVQRNVY